MLFGDARQARVPVLSMQGQQVHRTDDHMGQVQPNHGHIAGLLVPTTPTKQHIGHKLVPGTSKYMEQTNHKHSEQTSYT